MTERLNKTIQYLMSNGTLTTTYPSEGPCLQAALTTLQLAGAVTLREAFGTKAGIADIIACYRGHYVAVECKSATGEPSEQQKRFCAKVVEAGGAAVIVRCMQDITDTLVAIENAEAQREK